MAEFTLEALKDAIVNDTENIGLKNSATATDWKSDEVIAGILNDKTLTSINRDAVTVEEIKKVIVQSEFSAATAAERDYLTFVLSGNPSGVVDTKDGEIRTGILNIFGVGSTSRTNLTALVNVSGSWAQAWWGENTTITPGQVGRAFNLI